MVFHCVRHLPPRPPTVKPKVCVTGEHSARLRGHGQPRLVGIGGYLREVHDAAVKPATADTRPRGFRPMVAGWSAGAKTPAGIPLRRRRSATPTRRFCSENSILTPRQPVVVNQLLSGRRTWYDRPRAFSAAPGLPLREGELASTVPARRRRQYAGAGTFVRLSFTSTTVGGNRARRPAELRSSAATTPSQIAGHSRRLRATMNRARQLTASRRLRWPASSTRRTALPAAGDDSSNMVSHSRPAARGEPIECAADLSLLRGVAQHLDDADQNTDAMRRRTAQPPVILRAAGDARRADSTP